MAKNKKTVSEEEKIAKERAELIKQYNRENLGESYLEDSPATEDDANAAKARFEAAQEAFNKKTYTIADKQNAKRVAEFLKNWNEKYATWEKDQWVGVVRFNSYITDFLNEFEKEEQDLILDYGALSFLDVLMMKPFGIGLEAAKQMESMNDEYNKILEVVDDLRNDAIEEQQNIKKIQEEWAAAATGFKLHYLTKEEKEEFEKTHVLGLKDEVPTATENTETTEIVE